jgi:hypothetical protein
MLAATFFVVAVTVFVKTRASIDAFCCLRYRSIEGINLASGSLFALSFNSLEHTKAF